MAALRIVVALVIVIVWAFLYVAAFLTHQHAPAEVTPVMLLVVTWLFASGARDTVRRARRALEALTEPDGGPGDRDSR